MRKQQQQRPSSAQPTRQGGGVSTSVNTSSSSAPSAEAASLLRRARASGVDTTPMDLQRFVELQDRVDRVLSAPPPASTTTSSIKLNPSLMKRPTSAVTSTRRDEQNLTASFLDKSSSTACETADLAASASLYGPSGTVTIDSLKRMPSLANLSRRSEAAASASIALGSPPPLPSVVTSSTTAESKINSKQVHEVARGWIPVSVPTDPPPEDFALSNILENVERRRALRQSYPKEGEDVAGFTLASEVQQRHQVVFAFSERDVMAPDTAALLDSKAAVRDILSKHDDRSVFKHNAEGDLGEWLTTLPATAKVFDEMINERCGVLDQELTDEQKSLAAVEAGTVQLEASIHQLNQFGNHMFDTIFDMEDQRAEISAAEAKARKKSHRSVGTSTVIVVVGSQRDVMSPMSPATPSSGIPYGCRLLPEEIFSLGPAADQQSTHGGGSATSSFRGSQTSPPSHYSSKSAAVPPVEPLDVSMINSSFAARTPTVAAAGAVSPSNSQTGSTVGGAGIEHTLAAFHHSNALAVEVERLRRECERREMEKRQFSNFSRDRMASLAEENAALLKLVADARKDVQTIFVDVGGVDIPWEEVGNGRSAAEFLRDALPLFAEAVMHNTRSDISAALLHQVRADVQEEIAELKKDIASWPNKVVALEHAHEDALGAATKRQSEIEHALSIRDAQLAEVKEALFKASSALSKSQDECEKWKQDFLKRSDALHNAHDLLHDSESHRKAADHKSAQVIQSAHRIADTLTTKISVSFDRERKALERQIQELVSEKNTAQKDFAQQQSLLEAKIERLTGTIDDIRKRTVDQSTLRQVLEELLHSFSTVVMQQSKRLRESLLKDVSSVLRATSGDVCQVLSQCFQNSVERVGGLLEVYFETTSNTTERNRLKRVEFNLATDAGDCQRAIKDLQSIVDPTEAATQALRQHVVELEAKHKLTLAQVEELDAHLRRNDTTQGKRLDAVMMVVKHLFQGLVAMLDQYSAPTVHPSAHSHHYHNHVVWTSLPSAAAAGASNALDDESVVDGFAHWAPLLQMSNEIYHSVRHAAQTISAAAARSHSAAIVPPSSASLDASITTEGVDIPGGGVSTTSSLHQQQQRVAATLQQSPPLLEKGGSFIAEFQDEINTLRVGLQPSHIQALKSGQQLGDVSAVALLTCRKAMKASVCTFADPLVEFLRSVPTWSLFRSQQQQPFGAGAFPSSAAVTPFNRSPFETPSHSTCVSPTHRTSVVAASTSFRNHQDQADYSPSRAGSIAIGVASAAQRKVDAATTKATNAVDTIRNLYTKTIWGILRLAVVKRQLSEELDAIEHRCSLLSRECEQRVAGVKMERQRLIAITSPDGGTVAQQAMLTTLHEKLSTLADIRAALIDRFAEKLRRFVARRHVAVQQAEASLMRQLNKVAQGIQDGSKALHEFYGRVSAAATAAATSQRHVAGLDMSDAPVIPPTALALSGSGGNVSPERGGGAPRTSSPPPPFAARPAFVASYPHFDDDEEDGETTQLRTDLEIIRRENTQLKQMMEALQFRQQAATQQPAMATTPNGDDGGTSTPFSEQASTTTKSFSPAVVKTRSPPSSAGRRRQSAFAPTPTAAGDDRAFIPATFTKQRASVVASSAGLNHGGGRSHSSVASIKRRASHASANTPTVTPAATPRDVGIFSDRDDVNSELPSMTEWANPFSQGHDQPPHQQPLFESTSSTPPPHPPLLPQQQQDQLMAFAVQASAAFNAAVLQYVTASPTSFSVANVHYHVAVVGGGRLTEQDFLAADQSALTGRMVHALHTNQLAQRTAAVDNGHHISVAPQQVADGTAVTAVPLLATSTTTRRPSMTTDVNDRNESTMPFNDGGTSDRLAYSGSVVVDHHHRGPFLVTVGNRDGPIASGGHSGGGDASTQTEHDFIDPGNSIEPAVTTPRVLPVTADSTVQTDILAVADAAVSTEETYGWKSSGHAQSLPSVDAGTQASGEADVDTSVSYDKTLPVAVNDGNSGTINLASPSHETKFAKARGLGQQLSPHHHHAVSSPFDSMMESLVLQGNHASMTKRPQSANSGVGRAGSGNQQHTHQQRAVSEDGCVQTDIELLVPLLMSYMQSSGMPPNTSSRHVHQQPSSTLDAPSLSKSTFEMQQQQHQRATSQHQPRPSSASSQAAGGASFKVTTANKTNQQHHTTTAVSTITMTSGSNSSSLRGGGGGSSNSGSGGGVFRARFSSAKKPPL